MGATKHRMRFLYKVAVQLPALTILFGCLSPIDFEVENIGGRLVVSGQISTIADQNIIRLGLTADTRRLPIPVAGAKITLHDHAGNVIRYEEKPDKAGVYEGKEAGIPGRTYHIRIETIHGEVYESSPEKMPEATGDDSIHYKFGEEKFVDHEGTVSGPRFFLKAYSKSVLPKTSTPLYLRWSTEEVYIILSTNFPNPFGGSAPSCFVSQPVEPQRIVLFNGSELKTNVIEEQALFSRLLDQSFHTRHYFTVYQSSHTAEAFEYWRKVNIVASQVGSVFDTPPAEIVGNIRNVNNSVEKIYGYFQAVHQTYNRFFLVASDLPYIPTAYCEYNASRDYRSYPRECLDCSSIANSSYERPEWF
jgi:hypothetical protein